MQLGALERAIGDGEIKCFVLAEVDLGSLQSECRGGVVLCHAGLGLAALTLAHVRA